MAWKVPARLGEPSACVAVVLTPELDVLLIRRADHPDDPWSGQMALPGGRREPGDADGRATAVRETWEETGVDLARAELIGELDDVRPRTINRSMIVRPFVFRCPDKPRVRESEEVAGHAWVPLRGLAKYAGRTEVMIEARALKVDAFLVGTPPIWGMTHRILTSLLDRFPGP